jgi:hypothetical protein
MTKLETQQREEPASPTPAPARDDLMKDLPVDVSEADKDAVKAGKMKYQFYDLLIST